MTAADEAQATTVAREASEYTCHLATVPGLAREGDLDAVLGYLQSDRSVAVGAVLGLQPDGALVLTCQVRAYGADYAVARAWGELRAACAAARVQARRYGLAVASAEPYDPAAA